MPPDRQSGVQTSEAVTDGIRVHVTARYSPGHSQPQRDLWLFVYTIAISNEGPETVQLISRLEGSGRPDTGPPPEPTIQPEAEWTTKG